MHPKQQNHELYSLEVAILACLQVNIIRKPKRYSWRKVPEAEECHTLARSLPPSAVGGIVINSSNVTVNMITLALDWLPPSKRYGSIVGYDILVTDTPSTENETIQGISMIANIEVHPLAMCAGMRVDSRYTFRTI